MMFKGHELTAFKTIIVVMPCRTHETQNELRKSNLAFSNIILSLHRKIGRKTKYYDLSNAHFYIPEKSLQR